MATASLILILVGIASIILVTIVLVRTLRQLERSGAEVEQLARTVQQDLLPRIERVLTRTENELVELEAVTQSARGVAQGLSRVTGTLGDIAGQVQIAVTPVLHAVTDLGGILRQVSALAIGVKAGLHSFRRPRYELEDEDTGNLFH